MKTWIINAPFRFINKYGEVMVATDATDEWKGMEGYDVVFAHEDAEWQEWKVRFPKSMLEVSGTPELLPLVNALNPPWTFNHNEQLFVASVLLCVASNLESSRKRKDRLLSARLGKPVTCFTDEPV